jgi:inward rectifier potassium channel
LGPFARAFFFSVHTLTTVGYGALYPFGMAANAVAGVEAALGLMGFAMATGLLYGRFSRPSARLIFSEKMVMSPFHDGQSLQFRIANQRQNVLMDLDADMMLMTVENDEHGQMKRVFKELKLERRRIYFLALTWTIVHPLDPESPLFQKTAEDLQRMQAEIIILIRGFDDSFSQVVHSRYSYRWDEIEWSARFAPAFEVAEAGHLVLDVERVGSTIAG